VNIYYTATSKSAALTVLLLHHHQLLFLHVAQSGEKVIIRLLSEVLVSSVLAVESCGRAGGWWRCAWSAEAADVKHGQRLLGSDAVEG